MSEVARAESAVAKRSYARAYTFLLGTAAVVLTIDQIAKAVVTSTLKGSAYVDVLGGLLRLDYTENSGAAFSIFRNGSAVFALVAICVVVGILFYYKTVATSPLMVRASLGLIVGGAIGNLVDRVRLGYVVDFIDLRWWPVFNVADSAIVLGVTLLLVHALIQPSTKQHT